MRTMVLNQPWVMMAELARAGKISQDLLVMEYATVGFREIKSDTCLWSALLEEQRMVLRLSLSV